MPVIHMVMPGNIFHGRSRPEKRLNRPGIQIYITEDENNFEENFQKLDIHLFYGTSIFQDRHIKVIISFRCTMGLSTMRLEVRDEASARFFEAMIDGGRCCR